MALLMLTFAVRVVWYEHLNELYETRDIEQNYT
ncbi:MAG: hypothetical protein ACI9BF_000460 [Candidatus Paceibacteria bacterium]|jgi:hypothetical protein